MGVTLPRLLPSEIRRMQAPIQKHWCKRAARAGSNLPPGCPSEMLKKKELVTPSSLARCHPAASSRGCVEPAKEHSPSEMASCWRHCPGFSFGGPEQGMPWRGFKQAWKCDAPFSFTTTHTSQPGARFAGTSAEQLGTSVGTQMFYAGIRCNKLCSQNRSLGEAWYLLQQP